MDLIKATRRSQRALAMALGAETSFDQYEIVGVWETHAIVGEARGAAQPFVLSFSPAPVEWASSATVTVDNYGTVGAQMACGIVSIGGTLALEEGVIEHNYTGNTSPGGAVSGGGGGLSGVGLSFDITDPDSPVLQMTQDSAVLAAASLPKASPVQGGIVESAKFSEIGEFAGDMDGGNF